MVEIRIEVFIWNWEIDFGRMFSSQIESSRSDADFWLIDRLASGGGKSHIWVVDLFNSSKLLQITKGNYNDREPRWSSDGKSIVFTRIIENMKLSHIMKVNIDTLGEPETIVSDASRNWLADYSPDGTLLAYTRSMSTNGSRNVIILRDVSSGHEEELKFPGINDSYRPVWLADGSGFVFHVNKKAGKQLYKANFSRE